MVRAVLWRTVGSIPARGPIVDDEFFSTVPGLNSDVYDFHSILRHINPPEQLDVYHFEAPYENHFRDQLGQ